MTNIVPYVRQIPSLKVDGNEPGLISSYNMVRNGTSITDETGSNTGTIVGGAHNQYSSVGKSLYFNASSEVNIGNDSSLEIPSESISLSFLVRFNDLSVIRSLISKGSTSNNQNYFLRCNLGQLQFYFRDSGNTSNVTYTTNDTPILVNRWYHITLSHTFGSGSLTKIIVNGVDRPGTWTGGTGNELPYVLAFDAYIGSRNANLYMSGDIVYSKIYNIYLTQERVINEYNWIKKSALWKMCYGVNISASPVTGGNIENSPVRVTNGAFQVSSYSINGLAAKCYECTTAGTIELMSGYYHANPVDAAFGDYELHIVKAAGHTTKLGLINQQRDNTANGYGFQILTDGTTTIEEWGVGTVVSGGSITPGTLTKLNLKRRQFDDRLEGVIDDTSFGTGTDSTILQSYYSVFDCGVGDKIIISDINGDHAYTKRVFA